MNSGLFIKLDVAYYEDASILEVSDAAELLFVRSICMSKRIGSDGFLTEKQLDRLGPFIGTESVTDLATDLARVGLFERVAGGYQISAFLKHNSAMEAVQSQRKGGEYGNHLKWHVNRGLVKAGCKFCSDPSVSIGTDIGTDSVPIRYTESTETETETETERELSDFAVAPTPEVAKVAPKRKKATPVPSDFPITDALKNWAVENHIKADLSKETEKFLDYYRSKGQAMKDWTAAWRNWMRRAGDFKGSPRAPSGDGEIGNPYLRMIQSETRKETDYGRIIDLDAQDRNQTLPSDAPRALGQALRDS